MTIIRYADDAVLGFQKHQDAIDFQWGLIERLKGFGLKVHPVKTKLIRFGLFALKQYAERPSQGKPGAFDFLGFTHYIGKKFSGEAVVKRKTKRTRQITQLKRIKLKLRKRLHDKPWDTGRWLR